MCATAPSITSDMPENEDAQHDEHTSLLPEPIRPSAESKFTTSDSLIALVLRPSTLCILAIQFLTMFAYFVQVAPRLQLIELALCRQYYADADPSLIQRVSSWPGYAITEEQCKVRDVQSGVAEIKGLAGFLEGLCILLVAIPYGLLSERYGRRLVYCVGIIGSVLEALWILVVFTFYDIFSPRTMLASTGFFLLGGGTGMLLALNNTIGPAIVTEAQRTTMLYWLLSAYYVAYIVGSGLAPIAMDILWLPWLLALLAMSIAFALMLFAPFSSKTVKSPGRGTSGPFNEPIDVEGTGMGAMSAASKSLYDAVTFIRQNPTLAQLLILFPLLAIRGPLSVLIIPYASKRYHWTLAHAGTLDAISGTVSLACSVLVIPASVLLLQKRFRSSTAADATIAILSCSALSLGTLVVGLSASIGPMIAGWAVYACGAGVRMAMLSLTMAQVSRDHLALLNTAVISIETCADLTLSPSLWLLWKRALAQGHGAGLGMPWLVVSGLLAFVTAALVLITVRTRGSPISLQ